MNQGQIVFSRITDHFPLRQFKTRTDSLPRQSSNLNIVMKYFRKISITSLKRNYLSKISTLQLRTNHMDEARILTAGKDQWTVANFIPFKP